MTSGNGELATILGERFARLSPKQQAVARVLLEDPTFVSFTSAAELADRAGTDAATVVRTCQSLGYRGWKELQERVRADFAGRHTFTERVAALSDGETNLSERVFAAAAENVAGTLQQLDRDQLDNAARAILGSAATLVVAGGVSNGPGQFLASSLNILGRRALLATGVSDSGAALGALDRGDVVVAVSVWRYLRGSIQALELAKELALTTIAITDSAVSPSALLADHVFVARTVTVGPRLGLAGIMTLLEALVAEVAALDPSRAIEATRRANRLYFDGNVLGETERPRDRRP